jgi:predicted transcriptional regulator
MDFDLFLTPPRWEILQIIAEKPSSPVEISEKLNTTVSYVSQQLKLLDAANLLIKEKTGAAEKGKPRTLFSLSNELVYITALTKKFSNKKLITLTDYHKNILKIWLNTESNLHYYIEKLFWKLEDDLSELDGLFIDISSLKSKIIILSESKKILTKKDSLIEKFEKELEIIFLTKNQIKKLSPNSLISLYDPHKILEEMKGGKILKDE